MMTKLISIPVRSTFTLPDLHLLTEQDLEYNESVLVAGIMAMGGKCKDEHSPEQQASVPTEATDVMSHLLDQQEDLIQGGLKRLTGSMTRLSQLCEGQEDHHVSSVQTHTRLFFPLYTVEADRDCVSGERLILHAQTHNILIEAVDTEHLDETHFEVFHRAFDATHKKMGGGLFLSMQEQPLVNKTQGAYLETRYGKPVLYLAGIKDNPKMIQLGIMMVEQLASYGGHCMDKAMKSACQIARDLHDDKAIEARDKSILKSLESSVRSLEHHIASRKKAVREVGVFFKRLDNVFSSSEDLTKLDG